MSLGTPGCSDGADADSMALAAAHDAGLVMATAAGNEGPGQCTVGSPGAAPKALTVGNMADMGPLGFFQAFNSSRGKTADGRVKPDVSAPGYQITSADNGTTAGYTIFSGTSMATPFVAGVSLLMLEQNPALSPQDVKDKIMQTAEDWGRGANNAPATTGADPEYGAGKLDAYAAIKSAGAPLGTPPPGPVHTFREGTLSAMGQQIDYPITVRDTRFPIAATMIIPSIVGGSATNARPRPVPAEPERHDRRAVSVLHAPGGARLSAARDRDVHGAGALVPRQWRVLRRHLGGAQRPGVPRGRRARLPCARRWCPPTRRARPGARTARTGRRSRIRPATRPRRFRGS